MATSSFLAKLIGPVLAVLGLGMLLNPAGYLVIADEIMKSQALLYFASALGLLGGVALVLAHNVWTPDWRVVITLLGWISILDSTSWILIPRQVQQFWSPLMATQAFPLVAGVIVLLLAAVLCYFGYAAASRTGRPA
jgi:hypothetical protein